MSKNMVKFVSYSGQYPTLCSGILVLKIGRTLLRLPNCLVSQGSASIDENYNEIIKQGEWTVAIPAKYQKYAEEITEVVNSNIIHGCCGGCA